MRVLNAAEIRAVEEKENEIGTPFLRLMELAGTACARRIMERVSKQSGSVAIVVGKGKNGGDGFVIARKLQDADYTVSVILAFGKPTAEDAVHNYELAVSLGVPMIDYTEEPAYAQQTMARAHLIVDAIFGIGFRGAASESQAEVFDFITRCNAYVVAIDVPSGVETDTGAVNGSCVYADITYALTCLKPAHVFYPAREACGENVVLDIGILPESFSVVEPCLMTYEEKDLGRMLPARGRTSHKNDYGHVLSLCGSYRMPGAACLCANAAVRSGAGLVTAAFPQKAYPAVSSHLTESMMLPLPDSPDGMVVLSAGNVLRPFFERATTLVLGCGLGQSPEVRAVVIDALQNFAGPVVLDADGVNAIAHNPELLATVSGPVVLTPHPGEMSRLTGLPVSEILRDRVGTAARFADTYGVTVLLKGPDTVVASSLTRDIYVNTTGNQGLAKGGSGDTLSGILAALLAQGMDPFEAAACAAYLHGKAAEKAAETRALRSLAAGDLIAALPDVFQPYE
ncbi:MAG: NAD(P)H-hydrate dehydratase [Clostridia bacterium]|nr:NAD(P)H-hydrate dehydratase [Clostridia bacterium]